MEPFKFNSKVKYSGKSFLPKQLQLTDVTIYVTETKEFHTSYPNVFQKYLIKGVKTDSVREAWNSNPMQFWQNQLNFAIWCATTGCGVSSQNHLNTIEPLSKSLYRFHTYYQIRRILAEMKAALPQDDAWDMFKNAYDKRAYEKLCSEFGVSPNTDWRRDGPNHGLGIPVQWDHKPVEKIGGYEKGHVLVRKPTDKIIPIKQVSDNALKHHILIPSFALTNNTWRDDRMSFTGGKAFTVDEIQQVEGSWTTFILDKSEGFTQAGVERLNDSIRTYVWAILGAQTQTRSNIIGEGMAFDAQKQFLANLEDAISAPVNLPSAVKRYQDVLQYAGSELNYVFGIGLYMAPSDMSLKVESVKGYNNKIEIAGSGLKLGVNEGVNSAIPISKSVHPHTTLPEPLTPHHRLSAENHEDEKTALTVICIAVGLFALWFIKPFSSSHQEQSNHG